MTTADSVIPTASTWIGAGIGLLGAVTLSEGLALGGFILAVGGFVVNLWHKRQIVKLERERLDREFPK